MSASLHPPATLKDAPMNTKNLSLTLLTAGLITACGGPLNETDDVLDQGSSATVKSEVQAWPRKSRAYHVSGPESARAMGCGVAAAGHRAPERLSAVSGWRRRDPRPRRDRRDRRHRHLAE